jgi:hypothetical protein
MKFTSRFEDLLRHQVNLDQDRLDHLEARVDAIGGYLDDHANFGAILRDIRPSGSWAHRTIIRPVSTDDGFDADVLLVMDDQNGWLPRDYCENVYAALLDDADYRERAHRKTRCVRVEFQPDFHIDLVPYIERDTTNVITNRTEPPNIGSFEPSDPEAFNEWLNARQQASGGQFIKVVRLVKYLRDFKSTFSAKSIILTTLLGERMDLAADSVDDQGFSDLPSAVVTLMTRLAVWLPERYPRILDPAGTGDDFAARYADSWNYDNFRARITTYADQMRAALDEPSPSDSLSMWRAIFGERFGQQVVAKMSEHDRASLPHLGEQFIERPPYNYPLHLDRTRWVTISGRAEGVVVGGKTLRRGFREFNLARTGGRVTKGRKLRFTAQTNVPPPYRLFWKVRNGGADAAAHNDLRGDITEATTKSETSKYSGVHFIDCYVVKDGFVVARTKQEVVIP